MQPYWYLASYPKSGNTWCRVFITELRRLMGLDGDPSDRPELDLNRDLATGAIASSRHWLDDQLGIDSSDLHPAELDRVRGRVGHQPALYSEALRYHKVHDAFTSPDSEGRPVVATEGCRGAVYILRHPADVAVSLSHFFGWEVERCVDYLLTEKSALCRSRRHGGHQVRQHLGRWDQHVSSWCDQSALPLLVLRYEDLLTEPESEFARLAAFLDLSASPDQITEAVANTRFDQLRAREDQLGGFIERPPQCGRFFRRGRSGEGREVLTAEQLQRLESALAPTLARFGYPIPVAL